MHNNTPDYHNFLRSLRGVISQKTFAELPAITIIYGGCDYLREKAANAMRGHASDNLHASCITMELREIADQQWEELLVHTSLLEPKTVYFIKTGDKITSFLRFLERLDQAPTKCFASRIVLHLGQKELLKGDRAKLEQANATFICCTAPRPSEEPKFVNDLARKFGINLDLAAINLLLQAVGLANYYGLENELRRLALLFIDRNDAAPISAQEIAPYLQLLKEEHIFQIDNLLLSSQNAQAQLLLLDLVHRGEAPIAIIGIIARHCRNAIRVMSSLQDSNSKSPNLPVSVLRSYTQYVRKKSPKHFMGVLSKCQSADVQLKTSPIDPGLLISELLLELGAPSHA